VLGGVETFVSGAGHYAADIVIDEAISIGAVGSGDRAVEILQGAARELARPRLENVIAARVAHRDHLLTGAWPTA
jgi:hypothetical protein